MNALVSRRDAAAYRDLRGRRHFQRGPVCDPERAENLAYTRFVLEAGYSGDLLDLLAALAPCVMGYGEIGARLAAEATSDTYRDWINTYAGADYQGACKAVGELLDQALTRRIGRGFRRPSPLGPPVPDLPHRDRT